MLELWQKSAAALSGSTFSLQTISAQPALGRSTGRAVSALQALLKVMAAETPGTKFSVFKRDALVQQTAGTSLQVGFKTSESLRVKTSVRRLMFLRSLSCKH